MKTKRLERGLTPFRGSLGLRGHANPTVVLRSSLGAWPGLVRAKRTLNPDQKQKQKA